MSEINRYFATLRTTPVIFSGAGTAQRFQGVDLSDPVNPIARAKAFDVTDIRSETQSGALISRDSIVSYTTYLEQQSLLEQARSLSIHMKGSYGAYSGQAAYDYVYERKDTHKRILAVGSWKLYLAEEPPPALSWSSAPRSEAIADGDEDHRLRQFVDDYGTHYLSSITYGFKYAIHGEFSAVKEYERTSASLKAAVTAWNAEGRADYETLRELTTEYTKIEAAITAGRITRVENGEERPAEIIQLRSLDKIAEFFADQRADKLRIYAGPIEAQAVSYWHTLTEHPRTQSVLNPPDQLVADGRYGVLSGTIVAWQPTQAQLKRSDSGEWSFELPPGWEVCDGRDLGNGRVAPDLRDKFIFGAARLEDVGRPDGSPTHTHAGTAHHHADGWIRRAGGGSATILSDHAHRHGLRIDEASSLPPLVRMIYIIKT